MEIKNDLNTFEEVSEVKFEEIEVVDTTPKTMIGKVTGCNKLNVREEPDINSAIVCVIDIGTELMIDPEYSTKEWYNVCTSAGLDDFCMRKFVQVTDL